MINKRFLFSKNIISNPPCPTIPLAQLEDMCPPSRSPRLVVVGSWWKTFAGEKFFGLLWVFLSRSVGLIVCVDTHWHHHLGRGQGVNCRGLKAPRLHAIFSRRNLMGMKWRKFGVLFWWGCLFACGSGGAIWLQEYVCGEIKWFEGEKVSSWLISWAAIKNAL